MNEKTDQTSAVPDPNPPPNDLIYTVHETVHEDTVGSFNPGYLLWIGLFGILTIGILVFYIELLRKPAVVQSTTLVGGIKYQSSNDYSFIYPDDWIIATPDRQQAITADAKLWEGINDFTGFDVVVYNPQSHPMQSVNVVVSPDLIPVDDTGLALVSSAIPWIYSVKEISLENLECNLMHIERCRLVLLYHPNWFPDDAGTTGLYCRQ
jgi:hypothetical protein